MKLLARRRHWIAVLLVAWCGLCPAGVGAAENGSVVRDPGWRLQADQDGLRIYERAVAGSRFLAFRGEGLIAAPIERVASVLLDDGRATEWVASLEESRLVRRVSPDEYVEYTHIATPFVVKDRDFVTLVRVSPERGDRAVKIEVHSIPDPLAPVTGYVRGELHHSSFRLSSEGEGTRLEAELHVDPKGTIPSWMVNRFQRDWPRKTFIAIRKQLQKDDIKAPALFRSLVERLMKGRTEGKSGTK